MKEGTCPLCRRPGAELEGVKLVPRWGMYVDGKPIRLRPLEQNFIRTLLRVWPLGANMDRLCMGLWPHPDNEPEYTENNIRVYANRIRAKLKNTGWRLTTGWEGGYRLERDDRTV